MASSPQLQPLTSNVIDIALIMLGALLLPVYFVIFKYDEHIFNMLQCTHVMVLSLYAVLYINYIKSQCFNGNEVYFRAFNLTFTYTMFIFFLMFVMYVIRIFMSGK